MGVPRRPRYEEAGAVHHVWARGVEKRMIFLDDRDRRVYVGLLKAEIARSKWVCLAWCLMGNHVHLLIQTPEPNLGKGMHWIHMHYARWFNDRYDRVGHLFQDRFGSSRLWTDAAVAEKARYIAMNPVEAGLCRKPEEWPWAG